MSAPFAFLYLSHAWNSGLLAFSAEVIRCVVSPRLRLRTRIAIRSEGSKFSLRYCQAGGEDDVGFSVMFIAVPRAFGRWRRSRIRLHRGHTDGFRALRKRTAFLAAFPVARQRLANLRYSS